MCEMCYSISAIIGIYKCHTKDVHMCNVYTLRDMVYTQVYVNIYIHTHASMYDHVCIKN